MSEKTFTSKQILIGAAASVAVLLGGGIWYLRSAELRSQYIAAAADCQNGRGAGLLLSLDRMNGEDARPKNLRLTLANCALSDAVDSYIGASQRARALSD